ncbi:hypothetical protein ABH924_003273 [Arthrobacter sp. GAS37]|uniref:hypothetical protein n=1 Tax=Arthrobacter sp. GAS37 TaxID=3156261 RepID=UPI003838BBB3
MTKTSIMQDELGLVSGDTSIILGAQLKTDNDRSGRVVFHFGFDRAEMHISTFSVGPYDSDRGDVLLITAERTCGNIAGPVIYASAGQANIARRVLTLLEPYFLMGEPGELIRECRDRFLELLRDREEGQVWCLRADDGRILHASVANYESFNNYDVMADFDEEEVGIAEGEDIGDHLRIERVPESAIPPLVEIVGAAWRMSIGELGFGKGYAFKSALGTFLSSPLGSAGADDREAG